MIPPAFLHFLISHFPFLMSSFLVLPPPGETSLDTRAAKFHMTYRLIVQVVCFIELTLCSAALLFSVFCGTILLACFGSVFFLELDLAELLPSLLFVTSLFVPRLNCHLYILCLPSPSSISPMFPSCVHHLRTLYIAGDLLELLLFFCGYSRAKFISSDI